MRRSVCLPHRHQAGVQRASKGGHRSQACFVLPEGLMATAKQATRQPCSHTASGFLTGSVLLQGMPQEPLNRVQLRIRAATAVITTAVGVSLLLQDWGPGNAFSPIRPALKRFFNSVYGVEAAPRPATPQQQPQLQPQPQPQAARPASSPLPRA